MFRIVLLLLAAAGWTAAETSVDALMEAGHWKRARALLEPRLQAKPNDADALRQLSRVQQAFGDRDAALKLAEKAVSLAPRSDQAHYQLAEVLGDMAQRANPLRQVSLGRRFKKEIDTTVALNPKHVPALLDLMSFYLQAPGILGGDKNKAKQIVEQIGAIDAAQGFLAQVTLARMLKQYDGSGDLYEKAVAADPRNYPARLALANYWLTKPHRDLDKVEQHVSEALKIDPGRPRAYTALAYLAALREKWDDVDAALQLVEKHVPDNLAPYFQMGAFLASDGKHLPRAEKYFRKYLTQEPEADTPSLAQAHRQLGLVLEKQGRKAEAISELQAAVKLDPDSPAKKDLKRLK